MDEQKPKRDYLLPVSILIAAVLVAVALIYNAGKKADNNPAAANPAANSGAPTMSAKDIDLSSVDFQGNQNASATLVEYGDYQCPFCARFFEQTEPALKTAYFDTGKVKFAYKDMAFLGPESLAAAQAASCAQDQGKFWQYHDALFNTEIKEEQTTGRSENTGNLNRALFLSLANGLGLNATDFASCLDSNKYKDKVTKETAEANAVMGADKASTPSFFLNGQLLFQGAYPLANFQQAIDQVLAGLNK